MTKRPTSLSRTELRATVKGLRSGLRLGNIRTPDASFMRSLHDISPDLSVHWNRVRCIWQVWHPSKALGCDVVVMNVMGPHDGYMTLDNRVLVELRRADAHRRGRKALDEAEADNEALEEKLERDAEAEDEDFVHEELLPALDYDLTHEVSYSRTGISIGSRNTPKEDATPPPRRSRNRFGAGAAPAHIAPAIAESSDIDVRVE